MKLVGNTPNVTLNIPELNDIQIRAKLELYNPTGSVKDRAACYVINKLLDQRIINEETAIVESSSGNYGIALAALCKMKGLTFHCVIDPLISPVNEMLIRSYGANIHMVTDRDENGGYLLNRIKKVHNILESMPNSYWVNQYKNPLNADAYYYSLGSEVCKENEQLDYLFIGVSSGGTITGLSRRAKEKFPNCKIIAVDVEGSVIFGGLPKKRHIPGIGSSLVPPILQDAIIDEVITVDEYSTVVGCRYLLKNHALFLGGSSGSILAAMRQYFYQKTFSNNPVALGIFCDRGERYVSSIYNDEWVSMNFTEFNTGERLYALS